MSDPSDLGGDPLVDALRDLGAHLDLGVSGTEAGRADQAAAILAALPGAVSGGLAEDLTDGRGRPADRRPATWVLVAATVVVVVGLVVVAVAPAREAVAQWLGIGAVRIERTDVPPSSQARTTTDPLASAPTDSGGSIDLRALAGDLPFAARFPSPDVAGKPSAAAIDPDVPTGLIEVRYPAFTFVALATRTDQLPVLSKSLGPNTEADAVVVDGLHGLWITGDLHELTYVDPDGRTQLDRVRLAGDVLLWEDDGVTYRVEGAASLDDALAIAESLR